MQQRRQVSGVFTLNQAIYTLGVPDRAGGVVGLWGQSTLPPFLRAALPDVRKTSAMAVVVRAYVISLVHKDLSCLYYLVGEKDLTPDQLGLFRDWHNRWWGDDVYTQTQTILRSCLATPYFPQIPPGAIVRKVYTLFFYPHKDPPTCDILRIADRKGHYRPIYYCIPRGDVSCELWIVDNRDAETEAGIRHSIDAILLYIQPMGYGSSNFSSFGSAFSQIVTLFTQL